MFDEFLDYPRRLVIVTGIAAQDREWEAELREAVQPYQDRVEVEFLRRR